MLFGDRLKLQYHVQRALEKQQWTFDGRLLFQTDGGRSFFSRTDRRREKCTKVEGPAAYENAL